MLKQRGNVVLGCAMIVGATTFGFVRPGDAQSPCGMDLSEMVDLGLGDAFGANDQCQAVGSVGAFDDAILWDLTGPTVSRVVLDEMPNFPSFPDSESRADDINESGQIVGGADVAPGLFRAYIYDLRTETFTDLGLVDEGDPNNPDDVGDVWSWAFDINDNGWVCGRSGPHLFVYRNGAMEALPWLGNGNSGRAFAINNDGTIVGQSNRYPGGTRLPVVWQVDPVTGDYTAVELGNNVGDGAAIPQSYARDINDAGLATGVIRTQATAWDTAYPDGAINLDGGAGTVNGVNNLGVLVGLHGTGPGHIVATYWQSLASPTVGLGTLEGDDTSLARDVSNNCVVVGLSAGPNGGHGFAVRPAGLNCNTD